MTLASSNLKRGISAHLFEQVDAVCNLECESRSVLCYPKGKKKKSKFPAEEQCFHQKVKADKASLVHKPNATDVAVTSNLLCPFLDLRERFLLSDEAESFLGILI